MSSHTWQLWHIGAGMREKKDCSVVAAVECVVLAHNERVYYLTAKLELMSFFSHRAHEYANYMCCTWNLLCSLADAVATSRHTLCAVCALMGCCFFVVAGNLSGVCVCGFSRSQLTAVIE